MSLAVWLALLSSRSSRGGVLVIEIATLSESVVVPSLVAMVSVADPADPGALYARPLSAALMLAAEPLNVMVESVVPSPAVKLRPAVPDKDSVPLVTLRVTVRLPLSISATLMAFPCPLENVSDVPNWTAWPPGTVFAGASSTPVTTTVAIAVLLADPSESVTTTFRFRTVFVPVAVGLSEVELNRTLRRTAW